MNNGQYQPALLILVIILISIIGGLFYYQTQIKAREEFTTVSTISTTTTTCPICLECYLCPTLTCPTTIPITTTSRTTSTTIPITTTTIPNGPNRIEITQNMQWILSRVYQLDAHDNIIYSDNIPIIYNTWFEPGTNEYWEGIVFLSNQWGDVIYKLNHLKSGGPEKWTLEISVIAGHENKVYYYNDSKWNLVLTKPQTPDFDQVVESYIMIRVNP